MATYISLGSERHLTDLRKAAQSGRRIRWTVNSNAVRDDTLLFYLRRPISSIVAVGHMVSPEARMGFMPGYPNDYGAFVHIDRMIEPRLTLVQARVLVPDWMWLTNPQTQAALPQTHEKPMFQALGIIPREQAIADAYEDAVIIPKGAGFGDPEKNSKVEKAAIRAVRARLKGWKIRDRQKDRCGYDLQCTREKLGEHAEVKGIDGSIVSFPITKKEYDLSGSDPKFVLYAVTNALTSPNVHRFTGAALRAAYDFRIIGYFAKPRR
jgi:hypothetical protein